MRNGLRLGPSEVESQLEKHGVTFADAVIALEDEFALTVSDPEAQGEDRFVSMGSDPAGRVLVTVYTHRGDVIRIISTRTASHGERKRYEELR